jgi:AraC-like DNA-binding protein
MTVPTVASHLVLARHAPALRRGLAPGTQRVGPLCVLPGLLREFGVRPAAVLRRAGLAADALADREARVPYATIAALLDACAAATGCRHFGLLAGSRWRLEHVGLPGEVTRSCATVGDALETFTTYQWLNSSGGVAFLAREGRMTTFGYAIFEPGMQVGADQVYDMVMAVGVNMIRELAGRPGWSPARVTLSRKRPDDVQPYRRFFAAPVQFDKEATALHFSTAFEATRVPTGDETRRRALEAHLLAAGREAMLPKLHRMIRVAMIFGLSSGDQVASAMALTRRTFNRRLAEYGTTFHEVLEAVRLEVAQQLLRETTLSIGDIGDALGYAEPSAFVRAYRRWTQTTPGAWREIGRGQAPR